MAISEEVVQQARELLSSIEGVELKKMFGALGFFHNGIIFGGVLDDVIRLKADEQLLAEFAKHGKGSPWQVPGRNMSMPYYEVPEPILGSRAKFTQWAERAIEGSKTAKKKPTSRKNEVVALVGGLKGKPSDKVSR